MKRKIPIVVLFIMAIVMLVQYFIPHPKSRFFYNEILEWLIIILTFAMLLGLFSLIRHHLLKIKRKESDVFYSYVVLIGLAASLISGFGWGIERGSPFMMIFEHIQIPMESTMFSLLAFFIASAAFRTFRARNVEATLLLIAAVIVMLGRVPVGHYISHYIPDLAHWILDFPNTAAKRGILIGVALGTMGMSIRIMLGIERSWMGGD